MYLTVHGVQIPGTITLCHHYARTAAKPYKQAYQKVDKSAGGTHSCQRVGAHKVTYDQGIGRIVQLLE